MSLGRRFNFQYRLVWKYQGEKRPRTYVSDSATAVLRLLRRIGTDEPWMGVTPTQLKRCWAWIARRRGVPFEAIADMTPKQALLALRDSFPALEYIRVESRQVAKWNEVLDPLNSLRTDATARGDRQRQELIDTVEQMAREQLDAWRWVPDEQAQQQRAHGSFGKAQR
jgi:hypothetical protein